MFCSNTDILNTCTHTYIHHFSYLKYKSGLWIQVEKYQLWEDTVCFHFVEMDKKMCVFKWIFMKTLSFFVKTMNVFFLLKEKRFSSSCAFLLSKMNCPAIRIQLHNNVFSGYLNFDFLKCTFFSLSLSK